MTPSVTSIRLASVKDSFALSELDLRIAFNDQFEQQNMAHWNREVFELMMQDEGNRVFVAKCMTRTVGYMAVHYSSAINTVIIQRMAVDPLHRRRDIGTDLISSLLQECYYGGISTINCLVPERNVSFQCFLRSNRFYVNGTFRSDIDGDDSYNFTARLP